VTGPVKEEPNDSQLKGEMFGPKLLEEKVFDTSTRETAFRLVEGTPCGEITVNQSFGWRRGDLTGENLCPHS